MIIFSHVINNEVFNSIQILMSNSYKKYVINIHIATK